MGFFSEIESILHFLVTQNLWLGTLTELVSGLVIALAWVEVGNVFPVVVCLFFFF